VRREHGDDADVGAALVGEFVIRVIHALTPAEKK